MFIFIYKISFQFIKLRNYRNHDNLLESNACYLTQLVAGMFNTTPNDN